MKRILILLLASCAFATMTENNFLGGTSPNWSTAANWSRVAVPVSSDSVTFNATSNVAAAACSLTAASSVCSTMVFTSGYTKLFKQPLNKKLTIGGSAQINSGGAVTLLDSIFITAPNAVFNMNAAGAITGTTCKLVFQGSNDSLNNQKAWAILQLINRVAGNKLTVVGTATLDFTNTAALVEYSGANDTLRIDRTTRIDCGGGGGTIQPIVTGPSSYFIGTPAGFNMQLIAQPPSGGVTITLDTLAGNGTGGLTIGQAAAYPYPITYNMTGRIDCNGLNVLQQSAIKMVLNTNSNPIRTTGAFTPGGNIALCTLTVNMGGSVNHFQTYNGSTNNTGIKYMNWQTSVDTFSGAFTGGTSAVPDSGTSLFVFDSNSTFTTGNKPKYDILATGILTLADSLKCHAFTVSGGGAFTATGKYFRASSDVTFGGTGNQALPLYLLMNGPNSNFTINTSGTVTSAACSVTTNGAVVATNFNSLKRQFGRWTFADGESLKVAAGDTISIGKNVAGDWSGSAGSVNTFTSGGFWNLNAPTGVTVTYTKWKNCHNYGTLINATDPSNIDLGGNSGIDFKGYTVASTPASIGINLAGDSTMTANSDSCIRYYRFEPSDVTINNVTDLMGVHDGNLVAIATVNADSGRIKGGLVLPGSTTSYFSCGDINQMDGSSKFSVSFWVKVPNTNDAMMFEKIPTNDFSVGTWCSIYSGKLYFAMGGQCYVNNISNYITGGQWAHIVITFNGARASGSRSHIYINTIDRTSSDATPATSTSSATCVDSALIIGSRANGFKPTGCWDAFQVWTSELNQKNIDQLFAATKQRAFATDQIQTNKVFIDTVFNHVQADSVLFFKTTDTVKVAIANGKVATITSLISGTGTDTVKYVTANNIGRSGVSEFYVSSASISYDTTHYSDSLRDSTYLTFDTVKVNRTHKIHIDSIRCSGACDTVKEWRVITSTFAIDTFPIIRTHPNYNFAIMGQSNGAGYGGHTFTTALHNFSKFDSTRGWWIHGDDPTGSFGEASAWPSMGNYLINNYSASKTYGVINKCVGAQGIVSSWGDSTNQVYRNAVIDTRRSGAFDAIILWCGETDMVGHKTRAQVTTSLWQFVNNVRYQLNKPQCPIFIVNPWCASTGVWASIADRDTVRAAIHAFADTAKNCYNVADAAKDSAQIVIDGLYDVHMGKNGLDSIGVDIAKYIIGTAWWKNLNAVSNKGSTGPYKNSVWAKDAYKIGPWRNEVYR